MLITDSPTHIVTFATLGDSGVGKTSLIQRFLHREFDSESVPTLSTEARTRTVHLRDKTLKLRIWDTAGQERFQAIGPQYYRNAAGILLVYDVTKRRTFEGLEEWIKKIRTHAGANATIMIVGNKKDLEDQRRVSYEEGRHFADRNHVFFTETSATEIASAEDAFMDTAIEICEKIDRGHLRDDSHGVKILTDMYDGHSPPSPGRGRGPCCF